MNPEHQPHHHEHLLQMPSRERLQQRLGMVAMDEAARSELVRLSARREGDTFSAENFVEIIEGSIEEHVRLRGERQPNKYTTDSLRQEQDMLLRKMPKILTTILSTDRDRREVLWFWFGREYEKAHADEPIDRLKRSAFIQDQIDESLKPSLPRKEKARQKKLQQLRQEMRPHTTARHNGHHPTTRGF